MKPAAVDDPLPLALPGLVMRRALAVVMGVLLVSLALGWWRLVDDVADELDGARRYAQFAAAVTQARSRDDAAALALMSERLSHGDLRHLGVQVRNAQGQALLCEPVVLAPDCPSVPGPDDTEGGLVGWLLERLRALGLVTPPVATREPPVTWPLPRPEGAPWRVSLAALPDSEQREALGSLLEQTGLLAALAAMLLLVMSWNVRRALQPLAAMRRAIAHAEGRDRADLRHLPTMPVGELEAIASALRHMAASLDVAEAERRLLGQKVLTLQEDERQRLARDLHDEFGQRLTALRVDAAWLRRRMADGAAAPDATVREVVDGMATQCEHIQRDIRQLLVQLQPFGPAHEPDETLGRLLGLLRGLVDSWARTAGASTAWVLELPVQDAAGRLVPLADAEGLRLGRPLALALYRMSQEALTNIARHADARHARLTLAVTLRATGEAGQPGPIERLDWSVEDDGVGLADAPHAVQQGNGYGGLVERAWSHGADLQAGPLRPGAARPGLRLSAGFEVAVAGGGAA